MLGNGRAEDNYGGQHEEVFSVPVPNDEGLPATTASAEDLTMPMTGAERSQALRDRNEAAGIKTLPLPVTVTERQLIQQAQDLGGFTNPTEFVLAATAEFIKNHTKA